MMARSFLALLASLAALAVASPAVAQVFSNEIKEADGSPDVTGVRRIVVSNGTLSDDGVVSGKKQVSITTGGGGGGTPSFSAITSGTNTNALVMGSGGSLAFSSGSAGSIGNGATLDFTGTGTIKANRIQASNFSAANNGELAIDQNGDGSTITSDILTYFNGGELFLLPGVREYPTSNGQALVYNSSNHDLEWGAVSGSATLNSISQSGMGKLFWTGTEIIVDGDEDGVWDEGERCLTCNAANTTSEDETVHGNLTVVGQVLVAGIPHPFESKLVEFMAAATVPTPWDCYNPSAPSTTGAARITASAADEANACRYIVEQDTHLTQICFANTYTGGGAQSATGSCELSVYKSGTSGASLAQTVEGSAGTATELDALGEYVCKAINQNVAAGSILYFGASDTCDSATGFPLVRYTLFGYPVDIP